MRKTAEKPPLEERYEIRLSWSDEDEVFVAPFPDFSFVGAHGDTLEEALTEARTAIRETVEFSLAEGKKLPEPKFRRVL